MGLILNTWDELDLIVPQSSFNEYVKNFHILFKFINLLGQKFCNKTPRDPRPNI